MSRRFAIFLLAVILLVPAAAAFCFRPTPILGVNGSDISSSINEDSFGSGIPCDRAGDDWLCDVIKVRDGDTSDADVGRYRVTDPDWLGCWEAERIDKPPRGGDFLELHRDGCITILDH